MPVPYQLVIDCADPDLLARFWARGPRLPARAGPGRLRHLERTSTANSECLPRTTWSEDEDRISDPAGHGPSIWFHAVEEPKTVKNHLHLDIHASGKRTGSDRHSQKRETIAEATRLAGLGASITGALAEEGVGPLCGGDERPRGQRVRHQLTDSARPVPGRSLGQMHLHAALETPPLPRRSDALWAAPWSDGVA